jgi:hypothetical protein
MKIYYVRHQAAGMLHEHPFFEPPTTRQLAPVLELCRKRHGDLHPKTEQPYWAKIVCVEATPLEDGTVEHTTTVVGCAYGGSVEAVDSKAAGPCPIREKGLKRWPDAPEGTGPEKAYRLTDVKVSGTGHVSST